MAVGIGYRRVARAHLEAYATLLAAASSTLMPNEPGSRGSASLPSATVDHVRYCVRGRIARGSNFLNTVATALRYDRKAGA